MNTQKLWKSRTFPKKATTVTTSRFGVSERPRIQEMPGGAMAAWCQELEAVLAKSRSKGKRGERDSRHFTPSMAPMGAAGQVTDDEGAANPGNV